MKENWYLFSYRNEASDDICCACGIDLSRKFLTKRDIAKRIALAKKDRTLKICPL